MADLSNILKEQIPINISTIIGKEVEIKHICQIKKDKLLAKYIKIKSTFESQKVNYQLNYLIPGNLSSYILNIMMMDEEAQISDDIDDDKADAIKEIVSTINGSCATLISGKNFDDIGELKVAGNEAELVENIQESEVYDSFIKFELKIENRVFSFIVDFSKEAKSFFEELFMSQECIEYADMNNDEEDKEDKEDKDTLQEDDEKNNEDTSQENEKDESSNETQPDDKKTNSEEEKIEDKNQESNDKNEQTQTNEIKNEGKEDEIDEKDLKKAKKLKLLIIIIAALLVLILGGFAILYFTGFFEPPPATPKKVYKNPRKNKLLKIELKDKKIDFNINMINVDKLNKRLALLTKYEILDNDILEKFKQEEKIRLQKLKIKKLEQFAKANKEESLKNIKKEDFSINDRFIYIVIESLKYKKYKKIIDSKLPPKSYISICMDKNKKVEVYIGPLLDKEKANILVKEIKEFDHKNDTKLISLTKDEFDKLCDF